MQPHFLHITVKGCTPPALAHPTARSVPSLYTAKGTTLLPHSNPQRG